MLSIIAHRGYWKQPEEKNSLLAFRAALNGGFGIETDFRDRGGELFIAHDVNELNPIPSDEFFKLFRDFLNRNQESTHNYQLAINIKSDGLQDLLNSQLYKYDIQNYFIFDASIPDLMGYIKKNINTYSRISQFESENNNLLLKSQGLWLDMFDEVWYDEKYLLKLMNTNKNICIVSPELHGKPFIPTWEMIKKMLLSYPKQTSLSQLSLCTDHPSKAKEFFYEKN